MFTMQSAMVGASPPGCTMRGRSGVEAPAALPQSNLLRLRPACPLTSREQQPARICRGRHQHTCRAASATDVENGAAPAAPSNAPKPSVKIDNQTDPFSTIVSIKYGDKLGELLDTVAALKNLNLNIRRAKLKRNDGEGVIRHKFFITDRHTADKIVKSARLEEIRLTILNNLMLYHPESAADLAWGAGTGGVTSSGDQSDSGGVALGARSRRAVETQIIIEHGEDEEEDGVFSKLHIRTRDRPGLLVEIVRVLKDINVNVISAEVDTEGTEAVDTFLVSYHGEPLNSSMEALVTNALQYYLSLAEIEKEESY